MKTALLCIPIFEYEKQYKYNNKYQYFAILIRIRGLIK